MGNNLANWLNAKAMTWSECLNNKRVLKAHVDALMEQHEIKVEYSGLQTFAHFTWQTVLMCALLFQV